MVGFLGASDQGVIHSGESLTVLAPVLLQYQLEETLVLAKYTMYTVIQKNSCRHTASSMHAHCKN